MDNVIGMQREVCKYVEPLVGIQLDTDSCSERRRRLVLNFLMTISLRELMKSCQCENRLLTFGWIDSWI